MNITYIHSSQPADQYGVQLRCRNLCEAIRYTGLHKVYLLDLDSFARNTPAAVEICAKSDLLIIHRYLVGPILQAIQYWKARDKKILVDFDQAVNFLSPGMPNYSFWIEGRPSDDWGGRALAAGPVIDPAPLEQFKWGLRMVDGATMPSSRLAYDWSEYVHVIEVPDYLNTDQYLTLKLFQEDEIRLGLGGDALNLTGLRNSGLINALKSICRRNFPSQGVSVWSG